MDELSINESAKRDEKCLKSEGNTSLITAESGEKLGIGVSLKSVLSPTFVKPLGYEWFVMRATYGRAEKAIEMIGTMENERCSADTNAAPIFAITPHETRRVFDGEKRTYQNVPCLPGLLFVLAKKEDAMMYTHRSKTRYSIDFIDFSYDHTQRTEHGRDILMRVPHKQMTNFLRVTEVENPQAFMLRDEECKFREGRYVRIVHGVFEGAVGRVARISNQTRVVIVIDNLMSYATSYIPKTFMEPLTDEEVAEFLSAK